MCHSYTAAMSDAELPLSGGQMTSVVRVGDTVRRGTEPWTPAVHSLLRHLAAVGFDGAPRPLGFDAVGREMLTYLDGEAGFFSPTKPVPPDLWSDRVLTEAAMLLRRYHDATVGFVLPAGITWHGGQTSPAPPEVVCHNDFAPYNCIFRDGHLHVVIDFDSVDSRQVISRLNHD